MFLNIIIICFSVQIVFYFFHQKPQHNTSDLNANQKEKNNFTENCGIWDKETLLAGEIHVWVNASRVKEKASTVLNIDITWHHMYCTLQKLNLSKDLYRGKKVLVVLFFLKSFFTQKTVLWLTNTNVRIKKCDVTCLSGNFFHHFNWHHHYYCYYYYCYYYYYY